MPFCPRCKRAFDAGTKECPEHHVPLVAELPFQTVAAEDTTWVEITSVGTEDEAELVKGFLGAEGIQAQVENVKFHMEPINFGAMGEIRIYVRSEDEERAMMLLREREKAFDERIDDDEETLVTDDGPATIDETGQAETDNDR
jgi:putative signal transducing protein